METLTAKRGWMNCPDMNVHSLLARLERNSAAGAEPRESGSFFSPLKKTP